MPHWEHFEHCADIGIRGIGATKEQAFEQAAVALTAVMTDPEQLQAQQLIEFSCEAPDDELLLVDWLCHAGCPLGIRFPDWRRRGVRPG